MDDSYGIAYESWRESLGKLCGALRSSALDGDVQRLRIKRELVQTVGQCRRVMAASDDLRASMQRLYEFMDDGDAPSHIKTKGRTR